MAVNSGMNLFETFKAMGLIPEELKYVISFSLLVEVNEVAKITVVYLPELKTHVSPVTREYAVTLLEERS